MSIYLSEEAVQTQMIMKLFQLWHLTQEQQAIVLGLSPKTGCLPQYKDIQDRMGILLAIHKYLRQAYPLNKELAYRWLTTSNIDFNNLSPFDIIAREGYLGIVQVRDYLELNQ